MFEEAVLTGVLNLRTRKLKEFPAHLCEKHDISDLVAADLSGNRLHEMPACLCELDSLETLQIRDNCLRQLPTSIHLLKSLTYLDLSGNQLTSLPASIFFLRLRVLLLPGNRLESLPREIRQLESCIQELDLSFNRLEAIPTDTTLLKTLRVLKLRGNRLAHLPSEIGSLNLLRILDVSANCLTKLPLELRNLTNCVDLHADENPLVAPPVSVVAKGRPHIFKWLCTQALAENNNSVRYVDWSFNRGASINATLRRGDRSTLERNMDRNVEKKVERRSRSTRFNTTTNCDSGYASTGDEHRFSHEFAASHGSLEDINERIDGASQESSTTDVQQYGGDLLKEVMLTFAEKAMERSISKSRESPPIVTPSDTMNKALDLSNNNCCAASLPPANGAYATALAHPRKPTAPKPSKISFNGYSSSFDHDPNGMLSPVLENPASPAKPIATVLPVKNEEPKVDRPPVTNGERKGAPLVKKPPVIIDTVPKSVGSIDKTPSPRATAPRATISSCSSQSSLASGKNLTSNGIKAAGSTASLARRTTGMTTSRVAPVERTSRAGNAVKASGSSGIGSAASSTSSSASASKASAGATKPTGATRTTSNGTTKKASSIPPSSNATSANGTAGVGTPAIEQMRKLLEEKLTLDGVSLQLPADRATLAAELANGVHLCNYANQLRSRSVPVVLTTMAPQTSLSVAKAKRNVENFISACRRYCVPESSLCLPADVLEKRNLQQLAKTVIALTKNCSTSKSSTTV
ncbi:Leucine rich repeat 4 [Aphelenchoides avenae]|nr:Leucine rich repeat 4 [Aphelenchus avenae]